MNQICLFLFTAILESQGQKKTSGFVLPAELSFLTKKKARFTTHFLNNKFANILIEQHRKDSPREKIFLHVIETVRQF